MFTNASAVPSRPAYCLSLPILTLCHVMTVTLATFVRLAVLETAFCSADDELVPGRVTRQKSKAIAAVAANQRKQHPSKAGPSKAGKGTSTTSKIHAAPAAPGPCKTCGKEAGFTCSKCNSGICSRSECFKPCKTGETPSILCAACYKDARASLEGVAQQLPVVAAPADGATQAPQQVRGLGIRKGQSGWYDHYCKYNVPDVVKCVSFTALAACGVPTGHCFQLWLTPCCWPPRDLGSAP